MVFCDIKNKKICCICDSHYQLINVLGLLHYQIDASSNQIDLYIKTSVLEKEYNLSDKLKKYWGISNIYKIDIIDDHSLKEIIFRFCFPLKYIKERTNNMFLKKNYYDVIFIAVPTHFSLSMFLCNKYSDIYYYEDGLGSYYIDLIKWIYPYSQRMIYQILGHNIMRAYPKAVFLNSPNMYNGIMSENVKINLMISETDSNYKDTIHKVFETNAKKYEGKKIIYLTQPLKSIKGFSEKSEQTLKFIENKVFLLKKFLIRIHPMDKSIYNVDEQFLDNDCGLWELVCEKAVSEETVLVGYYSTAQFTPNILYKKEPFIVFLYRLFPEMLSTSEKKEIERTIVLLRNNYKDKQKIVIPQTIHDFEKALEDR